MKYAPTFLSLFRKIPALPQIGDAIVFMFVDVPALSSRDARTRQLPALHYHATSPSSPHRTSEILEVRETLRNVRRGSILFRSVALSAQQFLSFFSRDDGVTIFKILPERDVSSDMRHIDHALRVREDICNCCTVACHGLGTRKLSSTATDRGAELPQTLMRVRRSCARQWCCGVHRSGLAADTSILCSST